MRFDAVFPPDMDRTCFKIRFHDAEVFFNLPVLCHICGLYKAGGIILIFAFTFLSGLLDHFYGTCYLLLMDPFLVCLVFWGVANNDCFIHVSVYDRNLLVIDGLVDFRVRFIQSGRG